VYSIHSEIETVATSIEIGSYAHMLKVAVEQVLVQVHVFCTSSFLLYYHHQQQTLAIPTILKLIEL